MGGTAVTHESPLQPLDESWQRALAIVAHPDDMEYGAASAVARWTSQGKDVSYLLVTRGQAGIESMPPGETGPLRAQEEINSARIVGVENVEFLDYTDGTIEYGLPLRRDIARVIRRLQPEVLISLTFALTWGHHALNMADHRNVGLAAIDAARDAGNRWVFPDLLAEGLEPWSGARRVLFSGSPNPTHTVDVTGFLDKGIASLEAHGAYLKGLGGNFDAKTFLTDSARGSGEQAGVEYAVTFEVFSL
jgi:LmbE family N-acetylglucosaminyl deacetylase